MNLSVKWKFIFHIISSGMFHHSYHLLWQPGERNLRRRWISLMKLWQMFVFILFSTEFSNLWYAYLVLNFSMLFVEGGREDEGEREGKVSEHWSFYGGAEAWTRDEREEKSGAWTLAWWASCCQFSCEFLTRIQFVIQ